MRNPRNEFELKRAVLLQLYKRNQHNFSFKQHDDFSVRI